MKNLCALVVAVLTLAAVNAIAQSNSTSASAVGTWKADMAKSDFGSEAAPKSLTLHILKDTTELESWRVDVVDDKGQPMSYSWSGPQDGSMQPIKGSNGQVLGQESLKRDKDGALLRHAVDPADGSTVDARATLSADGKTITDVMTTTAKDGKTSKATVVYQRVSATK